MHINRILHILYSYIYIYIYIKTNKRMYFLYTLLIEHRNWLNKMAGFLPQSAKCGTLAIVCVYITIYLTIRLRA